MNFTAAAAMKHVVSFDGPRTARNKYRCKQQCCLQLVQFDTKKMRPRSRSAVVEKQSAMNEDAEQSEQSGPKRKAGQRDEGASINGSVKKKQGWNTMSHLTLKRFPDDDASLTAGARRDRVKHPDVATAEIDPSGRASCKLCGERIPKESLRLCLWLECHKGYRNACTLHYDCFFRHPEAKKLEGVEEIAFKDGLDKDQIARIRADFADSTKKKRQTRDAT